MMRQLPGIMHDLALALLYVIAAPVQSWTTLGHPIPAIRSRKNLQTKSNENILVK
jgi:hypothetical protein